jgi:uncharacterized membrane protein
MAFLIISHSPFLDTDGLVGDPTTKTIAGDSDRLKGYSPMAGGYLEIP